MALYSIIDHFIPLQDDRLLEIADRLDPKLHHTQVLPVSVCRADGEEISPEKMLLPEALPAMELKHGESVCLDFGDHQTGYLTLDLDFAGSHPDAPAHICLQFAEHLQEFTENSAEYKGWVSGSWIQEEKVHIDVLPARLALPRRYAFRYLKLTVLDTSPKYRLVIRGAECDAVSSADDTDLSACAPADPELKQIWKICVRTLHDCMQSVFEDGPKRDRRLWMGDLRLQALANYCTFRNLDLVKRCLYLFGGTRFPDGRVSACLFTEPRVEADDTCMFDYMLFYPVVLEEYLAEKEKEGADRETLQDLYGIAQQQIDLALAQVDADGIVHGDRLGTVFIDWAPGLNKDGCAQAVLIYAIDYAVRLAVRKGDKERAAVLREKQALLKQAARKVFWEEKEQCFSSGGQKALATQVWMVLARVASPEEACRIFDRAEEFNRECGMMTPYMHHYFVTALLSCGRKEEALAHIRWYWGSMAKAGADTCFETWVPEDPKASPYGGSVVNSYCHAWSCTPAYLLPVWFPEA